MIGCGVAGLGDECSLVMVVHVIESERVSASQRS